MIPGNVVVERVVLKDHQVSLYTWVLSKRDLLHVYLRDGQVNS